MPKFKIGDKFLTTLGGGDYLGVVTGILIPGFYEVTLDKECPKEYSFPPSKDIVLIEDRMEKIK